MIIFLTNYLNIHQLPFSLAMWNELGDEFKLVSMTGITEARLKLGFEDLDRKYDFVIRAYESEDTLKRAIEQVDRCDVLIAGSIEDKYLIPRLKKNKLTFRYSERYFKRGVGLYEFLSACKHLRPFQKYKSLYYLCSSAYTPLDINTFSKFEDRMYKWGYFPELKVYDDISELVERKCKKSIMWCGRMVGWKHPEAVIEVAKALKEEGIQFSMNIVGDGEEMPLIKEMIEEYDLGAYINLLGVMPPQKVREMMEKSEIYLFTSDRNEGWGAVLNEAMNSACAVVASHEIGAVPYLIKDGENGLIYSDGDIEDLIQKTKLLLKDNEKRKALADNAYYTVKEVWNGTNAAKTLLALIECKKAGNNCLPDIDGPCSKAQILKDNWYQKGKVI